MSYHRILTIQDISCVGQCSMTVALPILSACGHEVCVLPTAVLSTHTGGFGKPAVVHLKELWEPAVAHWKEDGITFDVIYTGYLGSPEAIDAANGILDSLIAPGGIVVVDPAMADHGKLYSGLSIPYAERMMRLCSRADIIVPNVTEAAMLCGMEMPDEPGLDWVWEVLRKLEGPNVVLTGVAPDGNETGAAVRIGNGVYFACHEKLDKSFHGTGDVFASAMVGALCCGKSLNRAAEIAGRFTLNCIRATMEQPAHWYGVKFEEVLPELIRMVRE